MSASAASASSGVSAATAATSSRTERVMLASELHGLLVLPEDVLQGARDLAERRVRLHGLHDRVHEIARGPRFVTEARERARHGAPVPVPANPFESCDLGGDDLRVG